jgi:hypothetical protein
MPADVLKLVESVLAEKTALANKERQLISNLNRVLPGIGYRVVPIGQRRQKVRGRRRSARLTRSDAKPLSCPQCGRTFAHPLHLGRHLSATHGMKRAGKGRVKARKKAS